MCPCARARARARVCVCVCVLITIYIHLLVSSSFNSLERNKGNFLFISVFKIVLAISIPILFETKWLAINWSILALVQNERT